MSANPKVSVCIPSYNHAKYLPATIESVLRQTFQDFEIVIVDDGSSDDSLRIAQEYAAQYPSVIRVYTHPNHSNRGISATVNLAFEKSKGTYWSGLSSDDLLYPEKLAHQVAYLESHPNVGWVYTYTTFIDDEGHELPGVFGTDITKERNPIERLIENNLIAGMTVLARRKCVEKVGRHEEGLIYSDWDFWVRMVVACKVGVLPYPLVKWRSHGSNASFGVDPKVNIARGLEVMASLQQKASSIGGDLVKPRTQALIFLQKAFLFFGAGDMAAASQSLAAAFKIDPSLLESTEYFVQWLQARRHERWILPLIQNRLTGCDFGNWILAQLPTITGRPLSKRLLRQVKGAEFAHKAFESYQDKNLKRTRQMAIRCLMDDPHWITNRHLLGVLGKSLVGSRVIAKVRQVKELLSTLKAG